MRRCEILRNGFHEFVRCQKRLLGKCKSLADIQKTRKGLGERWKALSMAERQRYADEDSLRALMMKGSGKQQSTAARKPKHEPLAPPENLLQALMRGPTVGVCNAVEFASFSDMIPVTLGKTGEEIFVSLRRLDEGTNCQEQLLTDEQKQRLTRLWEKGQRDGVSQRFAPLSPQAKMKFERFCAARAASFDLSATPIAELFCAFRGLKWNGTSSMRPVAAEKRRAFKTAISRDRCRNVLEKAVASRIASKFRCVDVEFIDNVKEQIIPESEIVSVARDIAASRQGMSMYDAVMMELKRRRDLSRKPNDSAGPKKI